MSNCGWDLDHLEQQELAEERARQIDAAGRAFEFEARASDRVSVVVDEPMVFRTRSLIRIRGEIEGRGAEFWYEVSDGGDRLYANVNHWLLEWQDFLARVDATANELWHDRDLWPGSADPSHPAWDD